VTSKSITIEWETPDSNGGSEITAYIIEKLLTKSSQWSRVATLDSYCLSYCIDNLKETSDLSFRVLAENAVGISAPAYTDSVVLKTHASTLTVDGTFGVLCGLSATKLTFLPFVAVPSPPSGPLEINLIGATTNVVEWGVPESDGGAPLLGYNIAIRDIRKTMWIEVGRCKEDVQKFNLRELQEGHKYLIRIYARNEVGLSDPLESEEPYEVLHGMGKIIVAFLEFTSLKSPVLGVDAADEPRSQMTGWSTENTSSWMREHNMDADISTYAKAKLLRRDEYFFKIWHHAKKLFK
jgi:Fibronectin type III domain